MFDVKDYATVIPASLDADAANVMRQALAGMLQSKQFYYYDVDKWLEEHDAGPFKPKRHAPRNEHWHHMYNADIVGNNAFEGGFLREY